VRRWWALLGWILWAHPAFADGPAYFSANQFDLPARGEGLLGLEPSRALQDRLQTSGRVSYLLAPLNVKLGAPSDTPTRGAIVSDLFLVEAGAAVRVLRGLDVGAVLVWHAFQAGSGLSGVSSGAALAPTAFGDARLSLGYGFDFTNWSLRPFAIAHLPTGDATNFAGEGSFHAELGAALGHFSSDYELSLDVRGHFREPKTLGLFTLGQQLRVALGGRFRLGPLFWLGVEGYVAPILDSQPAPEDGQAASYIPSELLAHGSLEVDRWLITLGLGVGLPLGHLSSVNQDAGGQVAPSTPAMRSLLEVRYQL